ncbi:hypothetical protein Leryth_006839 [Lithospermum erythrorhizon]|nr:hypothetical protein Leryth_006839 [Lithospermum erythrorhizon]
MADHEGKTENVSHGNEWEVIPDLDEDDSMNVEKSSSINRAETSDIMYMSGHFVFPPSQHENLPLEPETHEVSGGAGPESIQDLEGKSYIEGEDNLNIGESNISYLYSGIPIFDQHGNIVDVSGTELQGGSTLKKENIYNAVKYSSFQSESVADEDNTAITESPNDQGFVSSTPIHTDKDEFDESNLPCEAWWKKHSTSIYVYAKGSNAFWSIFVATTVMGLVILGQHWQQERWKVLQLKWQLYVNEEKMSRVLRPLIRFKDVIVAGYRPGSFIRGSSSVEH